MTWFAFPFLNKATNAARVEETQPLSQTYVSETLADSGTISDTADYYYYVDMAGFRKSGYQFEVTLGGSSTVAITFWGTMQDDGTAPASCAYQDITEDVFGVVSFTGDDIAIDNDEKLAAFKYVRIKVAYTEDTEDADSSWIIYHKRWW
jgi:hypothetical protein